MDQLTRGMRPYLVLSLLCVLFFVPGLAAVPPLDRDEARFVQATRQMLETGDYVRIQYQGEMRAKKPVGAYWLMAASVDFFSHAKSSQMWPYRLPAALAAWAAVLMVFGFGRSLIGDRPALVAGVLLASSLALVAEAHQAKTDSILLACVVAAQGVLARFYVAGRATELKGAGCSPGGCGSGAKAPAKVTANTKTGPGVAEALLFWAVIGFGILVKGPIVPVIALFTIAALGIADRNLRWFGAMKPVLGIVVAVAIAAPWFVAISAATDGAFVGAAVKEDLLPKLLGAQESHGGFPGLYLVLASVTFWPASLFLWPALVTGWGQRRRLALRFLLAWIVPAWVMFELIPTKLPHYVLPLYPALALLVAALVCEGAEAFKARTAKAWYALWSAVGLILAAAVIVVPMRLGAGLDPLFVLAAAGIAAASVLPAWLAWRGRLVTAAASLALAAAMTYPVVFQGVLPSLDRMFLSRGVAELVDRLAVNEPVAAAGYHEPSLVFLLGTRTNLTGGAGAADHLAANPNAVAVVSDREDAAFHARAAELGLDLIEKGRVDGMNYSRGKDVSLRVWGQ